MVGASTQGGEKPAAQMSLELSWCMQEGLEEAGLATWEEVPTTSACPMIQITFNTHLECKASAMCMELSIRHTMDHSQLLKTTMFPVLCAMLQQLIVAVIMIAAKTCCPSTWILEYSGYLMSAYIGISSNIHYRTMHV